MPKEINLSSGLDRLVCKELVAKKKFPILDVVEVLNTFGQLHLMDIEDSAAKVVTNQDKGIKLNKIVASISNYIYSGH